MKKVGSTKAVRALDLAMRGVSDPLKTAVMRRLTAQVIALRSRLVRDSVVILIRLGRILERCATMLDFADYLRWLRLLCISQSTALHWRAIYRLSLRRPGFVAQCGRLGGVKLWRLASMEPKEATRILKLLGLEGIEEMNKGAFLSLTAPHVRVTPNGHPSRRAQGLVNKLHQWSVEIENADVHRLRLPSVRRRLKAEARRLQKALLRLERALVKEGA